MNKRKLKKALKRVKYLPKNKYLILYIINKIKHFISLASESLYFKKPSESYIFVFTTKYFKIWDSSGETKITINQ